MGCFSLPRSLYHRKSPRENFNSLQMLQWPPSHKSGVWGVSWNELIRNKGYPRPLWQGCSTLLCQLLHKPLFFARLGKQEKNPQLFQYDCLSCSFNVRHLPFVLPLNTGLFEGEGKAHRALENGAMFHYEGWNSCFSTQNAYLLLVKKNKNTKPNLQKTNSNHFVLPPVVRTKPKGSLPQTPFLTPCTDTNLLWRTEVETFWNTWPIFCTETLCAAMAPFQLLCSRNLLAIIRLISYFNVITFGLCSNKSLNQNWKIRNLNTLSLLKIKCWKKGDVA